MHHILAKRAICGDACYASRCAPCVAMRAMRRKDLLQRLAAKTCRKDLLQRLVAKTCRKNLSQRLVAKTGHKDCSKDMS